jgi:ketosteroid isomerase-like protein
MDEHPNVELLRRGYEAYGSGDLETIDALFDDDIVWHVAGRGPLSGEYHGKQEVFGFFGKIMELSGGTSKLEVHDILASDDHGVALLTGSASREGREFSGSDVHVFHIRDGKVVEFWDSPVDQYAVDEFWA